MAVAQPGDCPDPGVSVLVGRCPRKLCQLEMISQLDSKGDTIVSISRKCKVFESYLLYMYTVVM